MGTVNDMMRSRVFRFRCIAAYHPPAAPKVLVVQCDLRNMLIRTSNLESILGDKLQGWKLLTLDVKTSTAAICPVCQVIAAMEDDGTTAEEDNAFDEDL